MRSSTINQKRNVLLIVTASIIILSSIALIVLGILYMGNLGWLGAVAIAAGVFCMAMSIMAIIKTDPSWLLLNLWLAYYS